MNKYYRACRMGAEEVCSRGCSREHTAMPQNAETPACYENGTADACQLPLAMGYVPSQKFENLYSHTDGWRRGTIFKDLDKPYEGGCCR